MATVVADSMLRRVWPPHDWEMEPKLVTLAVCEAISYLRAGYVERLFVKLVKEKKEDEESMSSTAQDATAAEEGETIKAGEDEMPEVEMDS